MATFDHQDILDLIQAGDVESAQALYELRLSKKSVSGQDQQTLDAAFEEGPPAPPPPAKKGK